MNSREIKAHPRLNVETKVTIDGTVGETFSLLLVKYFSLKNETDSIYVITQRPLLRQGERIKISGEVIYYSFWDKEVLAIKEL